MHESELLLGGQFTSDESIERMRAAMRGDYAGVAYSPSGAFHWPSLSAPLVPAARRRPKRPTYKPSMRAHRP